MIFRKVIGMPRKKRVGRPKKKATTTTKAAGKIIQVEVPGLDDRIGNIETILTSMLEMILEIQKNIGVVSIISLKQLIQQLVPSGQTMTIDDLAKSFPGDFDWGLIEQAIINLIEDGVLKPSKATSKRKIGKDFGAITRQ